MLDKLKKPKVLLVLFMISAFILGLNISDILKFGFAKGYDLTTQLLNISGWIFLTIFFFYYYIKNTSK